MINASNLPLVFSKGQVVGVLSQVERVDEEPIDVMHFETLKRQKRPPAKPPPGVTVASDGKPEIAEELLAKLRFGERLTVHQRVQLKCLVRKNHQAFQWDPTQIGRTHLVEHSIHTGSNPPIQQRQYPIPTVAREALREQIEDMLAKGLIRESTSAWRSPVLLVKKKQPDGKVAYRFCIDLKRVNSITTRDSYSLPRISETVDSLSNAKFFTTMDIDRAFWQVGVSESDKEKTAFVVDGRLFEFNVMPFGSMNAPATFQRLMDRVLCGLTWRQCLVYIDDILVFSSTFEQHLQHLDEVLARVSEAGLKLKPSKCLFANDEVNYLGFKISKDGLRATDEKTEAVLKTPSPETPKKLYSFLCSMNYYRTLIPKFGERTENLYAAANSKSRSLKWTDSLLKSFNWLKQALVTAPILVFPRFDRPFFLQTDASGVGISGVLLQFIDGLFRPVAFCSKKLSITERGYSATERELLAIVYAHEQFLAYTYGRRIEVFTDHEPLVTAKRLKNPGSRLGRLFNKLQDSDYVLKYIPGEENHLPDYLSRAFDLETEECEANHIEFRSATDWAVEQRKDPELAEVIALVESDAPIETWLKLAHGKRWLSEKKDLYIYNDELRHGTNRIVCPAHMRDFVCKMHHDSPFAGHRAAETTIDSIRPRYYWNFMPSDVRKYCESCDRCQKHNYATSHPRAPLSPIEVSRPWQVVGLDFMGPFKTSANGNSYIILAVDHFTKYAEGAATASFNAQTTASFLFSAIICRYGMVEAILTDQGRNFESYLFQHLCYLIGSKKRHTSTFHPASNGITERVNKTVKPCLAKYINDEQTDWDLFLPLALSAYNCSKHASTGVSPFEAVFGRPPVLVADIISGNQLPPSTKLNDVADYVIALRKSAGRINEIVKRNTATARSRQKANYDRFVRQNNEFNVGDKVKIINHRHQAGLSSCFEAKFLGPYVVRERVGDLNYKLDGSASGLREELVHYNRLAKYSARESAHREQRVLQQSRPCPVATKPLPEINEVQEPLYFVPIPIPRRSERIRAAERAAVGIIDRRHVDDVIEAVARGGLTFLFDESLHIGITQQREAVDEALIGQVVNEHTDLRPENDDLQVVVAHRLNDQGKQTIKCLHCNGWYEEKQGMRVHMRKKHPNV